MRAPLRRRLSGFERRLEPAEGHRPCSTAKLGVPYGIRTRVAAMKVQSGSTKRYKLPSSNTKLLPPFQQFKRQLNQCRLVAVYGHLYGHSLPRPYRDF